MRRAMLLHPVPCGGEALSAPHSSEDILSGHAIGMLLTKFNIHSARRQDRLPGPPCAGRNLSWVGHRHASPVSADPALGLPDRSLRIRTNMVRKCFKDGFRQRETGED